MKSKFVPLAFGILIAILFSLLPIYPLLVEGREITQTGESLYQEWRLVSMGEYYEYSRFVNVAWLESTDRVYVALFIVYISILGVVSFVTANKVVNQWRARRPR